MKTDSEKKGGTPGSEFLPDGTLIDGKYKIIHPLAEGGMGIVYKAEHILMRKIVAVKRLHKNLMHFEQVVQRFEREAQASAKIDHPNVCAVTDCGKDETGAFYIVMELLEGESLEDLIEETKGLENERVIKIAIQICGGLEKAHSMGVVHRDLKPENIMLINKEGKDDYVKIMDFGIAKMVTDDAPTSSLTQAGMIFGTPHFLSPEQAAGETIDHRSDLYSLGVLIFYMATGKHPFEADTVGALLRKHISASPPLLKDIMPHHEFPDGLQPVVSRLLAKNPEDRYPDAKTVKNHLSVLLEAIRIQAGDSLDYEPSVQVSIVDLENDFLLKIPVEVTPTNEPPAVQSVFVPEQIQSEESLPPELRSEAAPFEPTPLPGPESYGRSGRRWQDNTALKILGVSLAIIAAAAVLYTILTLTKIFSGQKESYQETNPERILAALEQKRALFNEMPEITRILSLSVDKKDAEALSELIPLESDPRYSKNPHYFYYLAYMYVKSSNPLAGIGSLERCLDLEPDYAYDPTVTELLVAGLKDKDSNDAAGALLGNHMSVIMVDTVEKLARTDPEDGVRRASIAALKRKNFYTKLPAWKIDAMQLADPDGTCETKRAAFSRIENESEKDLLPTLQLILAGRQCGAERCVSCIGDVLESKAAALSGQPASVDE